MRETILNLRSTRNRQKFRIWEHIYKKTCNIIQKSENQTYLAAIKIKFVVTGVRKVLYCVGIVSDGVSKVYCVERGTRYCWAWGQHSFETNKWTMFLETEASFPYCNWSTKMAGIIWLGSTSVQHVNNWQRLSRLPFLSLCKSRKFLETKTYSFISIKKKIICKKKIQKYLVQIWFA